MSCWKKDVKNLTSRKNPLSFYNWAQILNFFEKHRNELDLEEVELIVDRSEKNRLYLNEKCRAGIERCDVKPNVYLHLENLKEEKSRSDVQVQNTDTLIACHQ